MQRRRTRGCYERSQSFLCFNFYRANIYLLSVREKKLRKFVEIIVELLGIISYNFLLSKSADIYLLFKRAWVQFFFSDRLHENVSANCSTSCTTPITNPSVDAQPRKHGILWQFGGGRGERGSRTAEDGEGAWRSMEAGWKGVKRTQRSGTD